MLQHPMPQHALHGWRGAVVVLLLAVLGAVLAVYGLRGQRLHERQATQAQVLALMAQALDGQAAQQLLRQQLKSLQEHCTQKPATASTPAQTTLLPWLGKLRRALSAEAVYLLDAQGQVQAQQGAGSDGLSGSAYARLRQQLLVAAGADLPVQVRAIVHASSHERQLYLLAAWPAGCLGAASAGKAATLVVQLPFAPLDALLARAATPMLLLTPQGVAFAATRPEWVYAVAPPLTQQRIDELAALGQFGPYFDNGVASALPFSPSATEVVLDGQPYAVQQHPLDWGDPQGRWQLVMLDDISALMSPTDSLHYGLLIALLLILPGLLALALLRSRAQMAATLERVRVLSTALEHNPLAVVVTDASGIIEWVNPQFERNTGYCLAEVRGRKPTMLASGRTPAQTYHDMWNTVMAGHIWQGQFINCRRDGSPYYDDVTISPVLNAQGQCIALIGLQQDVTYRLDEQQAKRQQEARLRELLQEQTAIFDHAPPVLLVGHGVVRKFNPALQALLGPVQVGQRAEVFFGSLEQQAAFSARVGATLLSGQPVQIDWRLYRHDGSHFEARLSGRRVELEDCPDASLWILEDVSERQRAAQALQQAKERAEQSAAQKAHFLANMSHEIRTPMNAIIGMAHLALQTGLNQRQHDYISKIEQASRHLMGILNDILDFSRIEAGKLRIDPRPFVLDQVLAGVVDVIGEKAAAQGLELIYDVAPNVPTHLVGDALRIGQILINYANNAVKFTEQGEIGIAVRVQQENASGLLLRFEVRDTGIGLEAEQLPQLFQSFQQADSSTTRKYGGTGLGLAICKSLAELMGGEVGVQSQRGVGSSFWFTVPVQRSGPEKVLQPPSKLRGSRVLVVDDNPSAAAVLAEMLQSMGFVVQQTHSGPEALAALWQASTQAQAFALVLLDWQMPGMDGLELARRMGELDLAQPPRIAMVTAFGREDVLRSASSCGIVQVLLKPVNASMLLDTIVEVLACTQGQTLPAQPAPDTTLTPPALHGARVLLVEDNLLNQEVARALLEETGIQVDVAADGQIAVNLLQSQHPYYDLVLMDMQMPVMDGLHATRCLRADPRFATLPIIAMTANALEADRQRCLQAGMNEHLAKPMEPERLWQVLQHWIAPRHCPPSGTALAAALRAPAPPSPGALPPAIAGLDMALGLHHASGKQALYVDLLQRFASHHADSASTLRASLAQNDYHSARHLAHSLRGLAATLGASALSASAAALEQALDNALDNALEPQPDKLSQHATSNATRSTGASALSGLLDTLCQQLQALLEPLQRWQSQSVAPTPPHMPDNACSADGIATAWQQLYTLLNQDDPAAIACLEHHAQALAAGLGKAWPALQSAVRQFDFAKAQTLLEQHPPPVQSPEQAAQAPVTPGIAQPPSMPPL